MQKIKKALFRTGVILFLIILYLFVAIDLRATVYRSSVTGEVVRVEIRGQTVPFDQIGKRYNQIWVP